MRMIAAVLIALAPMQDPAKDKDEFLAITNVRILTITKGEIESGTILVKNGKIAEVGKEVKVPDGATVIDGKGLVAMPGFINAYSRLGSLGGYGGGGSTPQYTAFDEFNPTLDIFRQIPRTGFTTFAIYPSYGTVSGQGAVVKPAGQTKESMVASKSAFLRMVLEMSTSAKETLKRDLDNAKKAIEAEKKAEEEKKKQPQPQPGTQPQPQPGTQPQDQPKTPQQPTPKPDEKTQVMMRFLKGELPGIVDVSTPAQILHFWQVTKTFGEFKMRLALVCGPDVYKAVEELGARKSMVVLRPELSFLPYTRDRVNPAAELTRAGARVVLLPTSDGLEAHDIFLYKVAELVKNGLDRDAALKAFTIHAAEVLGMEKQIGSLEAGKDADVVLLSGDPLAHSTSVRLVFINGRLVYDRKGE